MLLRHAPIILAGGSSTPRFNVSLRPSCQSKTTFWCEVTKLDEIKRVSDSMRIRALLMLRNCSHTGLFEQLSSDHETNDDRIRWDWGCSCWLVSVLSTWGLKFEWTTHYARAPMCAGAVSSIDCCAYRVLNNRKRLTVMHYMSCHHFIRYTPD